MKICCAHFLIFWGVVICIWPATIKMGRKERKDCCGGKPASGKSLSWTIGQMSWEVYTHGNGLCGVLGRSFFYFVFHNRTQAGWETLCPLVLVFQRHSVLSPWSSPTLIFSDGLLSFPCAFPLWHNSSTPSKPFSNCECPFEASNPADECPVCVSETREHHCRMCSWFAQKWTHPS